MYLALERQVRLAVRVAAAPPHFFADAGAVGADAAADAADAAAAATAAAAAGAAAHAVAPHPTTEIPIEFRADEFVMKSDEPLLFFVNQHRSGCFFFCSFGSVFFCALRRFQ